IDLGGDTRIKGQESNPADVLVVEAEVRPNPDPNNTNPIDSWDAPKQLELNQQAPSQPVRRGRPPGSKNKPKLDQQLLPGFKIDADHLGPTRPSSTDQTKNRAAVPSSSGATTPRLVKPKSRRHHHPTPDPQPRPATRPQQRNRDPISRSSNRSRLPHAHQLTHLEN